MPAAERRTAAAAITVLALAPWIFFWRGATMQVLLGDGDAFVQFLANWTWAAEQWRALTPPLWSPYVFSGYPFFAEPQTTIFHPLQILFMVLPPVEALNIVVLVYHGVAGVFTFVLARQNGLTVAASLLGGLVFMFCGFLLQHQGITSLMMTAASFPTLLCALGRARARPGWGSCCLVALAVLHLVLAGHPQFTFYAVACGAAYGARLLWSGAPGTRRAFAGSALGGVAIGVGLSAIQLIPTAELMVHSVRDRLSFETFAGPAYPPPLLVASLLSTRLASVLPIDGAEGALDVGALPLLLAAFGIVLHARAARFWIGLLVVSALLWMGDSTPLYSLMYHVPGYNLFRLASRNGLMVDFAIAMLAAFGVGALQRRRGRLPVAARWGLLALVPLAFFFGWSAFGRRVFQSLWTAAKSTGGQIAPTREALAEHLVPLAPALAVLAVATVVIAACLWWGRGGRVVATLCIALTMVHFWTLRHWLFLAPADQVRRSLEPDAVAAALRPPDAHPAAYRIALGGPSGWANFYLHDRAGWRSLYVASGGVGLNAVHGVASIGGFSPMPLRDYLRLAGAMRLWGGVGDPAFFRSVALDLLDVRYVAAPPGLISFSARDLSGLEPVSEDGGLKVYRNPGALGLVWAVEAVEEASGEEVWAALAGHSFDPRRVALVGPEDAARLGGRRFAQPDRLTARWLDCNTLAAEVAAGGEALLAVSLVRYPGWRATVDGEPVPLLRANGALTALVVPAGRHRVLLRYRPASLGWGLACASLAAAALAAGTWLTVRRRRATPPAVA